MLVDALSEGEKVRVRFDIHDANQVWVLRMDGTFLCVAQWDAHKKAAWPVPYMDKKRQDRVDDKIKRAKRDIKEANAELGNVIEEKGEFVKNITDFIDVTASIPKICELTVADFRDEPAEIEKEASYLDTMMWINGEGADPRSKKLAAG
jgi:hypothetical protein